MQAESQRDYERRHDRVRRNRGRASGYSCEHCGNSAYHWATIHGHDGSRDDDYIALCAKCHKQYDKPLWYSPTHCPNDHEYTEENTWIRPGFGHRHCRQCHRENTARYRAAKKEKNGAK